MWCKQCQQDVPGLVSSEEGIYCCPRCNSGLRVHHAHQSGAAAADVGPATQPAGTGATGGEGGASVPPYDDWETGEQLRHVERILGSAKVAEGAAPKDPGGRSARLDAAHADPPLWHMERPAKPRLPATGSADGGRVLLPGLTWGVLSVGTMALVCGGTLLGWSLFAGRQELWTIGLPVALVGQIALLVGLVLQLDRLWHNSRHATVKLQQVDEQLHDLKTATTMLGTSHASPGGAFYVHLANGAGPGLLLSDLKAQLDLLALKMSECER